MVGVSAGCGIDRLGSNPSSSIYTRTCMCDLGKTTKSAAASVSIFKVLTVYWSGLYQRNRICRMYI